jgi:hypothetical protein
MVAARPSIAHRAAGSIQTVCTSFRHPASRWLRNSGTPSARCSQPVVSVMCASIGAKERPVQTNKLSHQSGCLCMQHRPKCSMWYRSSRRIRSRSLTSCIRWDM